MGKTAFGKWRDTKERAVNAYSTRRNWETLAEYDPDVIIGSQPYVSALSLPLSMGPKDVEVSSLPLSSIKSFALKGKRVLVFCDDPNDHEYPREVIESFGPHIELLEDFRYATSNPLELFTFYELVDEYGSNEIGKDK